MSETTSKGQASAAGQASGHETFFHGCKHVWASPDEIGAKDDFWPRVLAFGGNDSRRTLRRKTASARVQAASPMFYTGRAHFALSGAERDLGFVVKTPHFRAEAVRVHLAVSDCEPSDGHSRSKLGPDPRLHTVRAQSGDGDIAVSFKRTAADNLGGLSVSYMIAAFGEIDLPADARDGDSKRSKPKDGVIEPRQGGAQEVRMMAGLGLGASGAALMISIALLAERLGWISFTG